MRKRDSPERGPVLSELQGDVLLSLGLHRVHTYKQFHELLAPDITARWVQEQVSDLRTMGLVESVRQRRPRSQRGGLAPLLFFLTDAGAALIADRPEFAELPPIVPEASKVLARGEAHQVGVNDLGILFTQAARERQWGLTWRTEVPHPLVARKPRKGDPWFFTDAVMSLDYAVGDKFQTLRSFVEFDRCTEAMDQVALQTEAMIKFAGLQCDDGRKVWWDYYPVREDMPLQGFPTIMWVFDGAREQARADTLARYATKSSPGLRAGRHKVRLLVTTRARLSERGLFGPGVFFSPYEDAHVNLLGVRERRESSSSEAVSA